MKKGLTEIVFILDMSGSMHELRDDTIGGFNSTIENKKENECLLTTYVFNEMNYIIHDRVNVNEVKKLTSDDYRPNGSTALFDCIGDAISHIKDVHKYIREEDRPEKTIFFITTDGMENASFKYTSDEVKKMISSQKEMNWDFIFIGANIDSVQTARSFGISENRAANYVHDSKGTNKIFSFVRKILENPIMDAEEISCELEEIEEDYKNRS